VEQDQRAINAGPSQSEIPGSFSRRVERFRAGSGQQDRRVSKCLGDGRYRWAGRIHYRDLWARGRLLRPGPSKCCTFHAGSNTHSGRQTRSLSDRKTNRNVLKNSTRLLVSIVPPLFCTCCSQSDRRFISSDVAVHVSYTTKVKLRW
jgi:hypothetical protein